MERADASEEKSYGSVDFGQKRLSGDCAVRIGGTEASAVVVRHGAYGGVGVHGRYGGGVYRGPGGNVYGHGPGGGVYRGGAYGYHGGVYRAGA